jgi:hypothetical protein
MPWTSIGLGRTPASRTRLMRHRTVRPTMRPDSNGPSSDDESFDFQSLKETLTFIVRAPLRRRRLASAIGVSVMVLGFALATRWKPTYESQASILVQRNVTLPNFADSSHATQGGDFDPIAGASESVKAHANLLSIASQTHLTTRFPITSAAHGSEMSEEDKLEIMAKLVDSRLTVATDGGIVGFAATWTDPQTAYDLVSAAVHNFLDARNGAEVSIILDAISLLEQHAQAEREGIDLAMDDFLRMKDGWKAPVVAGPPLPGMVRPRVDAVAPDPDLARRIEEKKQQIREAEDERRRQLGELKTQMAGLLGTFTPSYPPVIALQRKIEALSEDPANLVALKNAERSLLSELSAKAAARSGARPGFPGMVAPTVHGPPAPASKQDLEIADPESAMALSRLQNRIHKYEEYMDQISAAKLQLDLARSAFRYRYTMHQPPELPNAPRHSVRTIAGWGSALVALFLMVGATAALDFASGLFLHPWQVKRKLSLPVLGEVTRP